MEHVQPLDRPVLTWRTAALAASVVALAAGSGLLLAHQSTGTRPAPARVPPRTSRVPKRQAARTPPRPRSRISVLVLNGNGISGAAGGAAADLLARGYRHAVPTDAPSLDYATSLVLYRPGWRREAGRLARDARIRTVAPLDGRIAPPYTRVPLVVILGAN